MPDLPTGTVTFMFTDIEGSTQLAERLSDTFQSLLSEHNRLITEAVESNQGIEVNTEGDSFFCVFTSAPNAVTAALAVQRAIGGYPWPGEATLRVRIGVHTGAGVLGGRDYVGLDVHRASRVGAAGHGGQIVISEATKVLAGALPEGAQLLDLGEHRLRGINQPEHLFQVGWSDLPSHFPPLRGAVTTISNLPAQPTSFVGRQQHLAAIEVLLNKAHVVTLTGPGGTGKTRLALQTATRVGDRYPDGVNFVDLSAITDASLFAPTAVAALGISHIPGEPLDVMRHHLSNGRRLLVLDNFEQILPAARQVSDLVRTAPDLSVLTTSRALLRIAGEHEYPVPPLGTDNGQQPSEAVDLFLERAGTTRHGFSPTEKDLTTIAAIVRRLDGLPLAIELAAAQMRLFDPESILERFTSRLGDLGAATHDLPRRQQTLRDAIGWSYDLLQPASRVLFSRLGVFAGGARLDQIEVVAHPEDNVIDLSACWSTTVWCGSTSIRAPPVTACSTPSEPLPSKRWLKVARSRRFANGIWPPTER